MGPVDERRQMYALDCYFRQNWIDDRLSYNNSRLPELSMNWQFLSRIWRPDTYIVNGKDSYLHMMTVPNRYPFLATPSQPNDDAFGYRTAAVHGAGR